jgi:hypothetical protein
MRTYMEPTVKIELNSGEVQSLGALLDAAVKATGLQGAKAAVPLFEKLEAAVAEFNKANPAPVADIKEAA